MKYIPLILLSITFCFVETGLQAADQETKGSAGIINDSLRNEFPAASAWDIGGQFRIRAEAKDAGSFSNRDFVQNLDHGNNYFLFRTKVHLGWTPTKWISAYVEGRDAHDLSDERLFPENDRFDLYQAFVRIGDSEKFPVSIKAGRQELIYGDQHYIGNGDWSNCGRTFDSVKLRFQNSDFWLDAFTGRPVLMQDGRFDIANNYDWFSGLYGATRRIAPWQDTEVFLLARNVGWKSSAVGRLGPRDIYTVGTRWKSIPGKLGSWDYSFEAADQFGSMQQNGQQVEHRAYAINGAGGYTWKEAFGKPRLGLGYDFGTGDSNPSDNRNETFEMLFGTNHRFYGNMDLMGLRNMHVPRIEGSLKPAKNFTLSAELLGFWLANTSDFLYPESGAGRNQNGYGRHPGYSSHVGEEFDLLADWGPVSWGQMRAGYGHFFVGDYIRRSVNSVPANGGTVGTNWLYAQFSVDF